MQTSKIVTYRLLTQTSVNVSKLVAYRLLTQGHVAVSKLVTYRLLSPVPHPPTAPPKALWTLRYRAEFDDSELRAPTLQQRRHTAGFGNVPVPPPVSSAAAIVVVMG
jgi:hypothetical protein